MTVLPSPPQDSGSSVQDTKMAQLKQEIERLRSDERVMRQERDSAKIELGWLIAAASNRTRAVKSLEDKVSTLSVQMQHKDKNLAHTKGELISAREKLRENFLRLTVVPQ